MPEVWEHTGEPTDEEIQQWLEIDGDLSDHLAIRPPCPTCDSKRTLWLRQEWCVCFSCLSSFTLPCLEEAKESEFWGLFETVVD